jgi:uroporphyrinogen decarboxylase
MRQAGRYMAEYRELRAKHPILELIKTPDLAMEVTLQPIDAFDLDAAIIFADILPVLEGMGLKLTFEKGEGPKIHNPLREPVDIEKLATPPAEEALGFTLEAIRRTRKALVGRVPLIGFSGAPFTLASYAIEGGGSRDYVRTKQLMYGNPKVWHQLMDKLTTVITDYMIAQSKAGAQALQLFDSWAGALSPHDYETFVLPHVQRIVTETKEACPKTPFIVFGTGNAGFLHLYGGLGADVVGADWRIDLDKAWEVIGHDSAIQGNMDPMALFAPEAELERQAARVLDAANNRPGHVFNIGHGIHRTTDPEQVRKLVDFVHKYSAR